VQQPSLTRSIAVRRVVAQAFVDDPLLVWIFPDESTRAESTAAWMGLFVEEYLQYARIDTIEADGKIVATALWRQPGDLSLPHPEFPSIPGLLGALVGADQQVALGQGLRSPRNRPTNGALRLPAVPRGRSAPPGPRARPAGDPAWHRCRD
jgi:hypothetical protein